MNNKEYALIVAGGTGTRMNSPAPKQFMTINGLPILMHTINAFVRYSPTLPIILVLPEADFGTWTSLCAQFDFRHPVELQRGGTSRFQSVKNGLSKIKGEGLVAIHDGVRPLISEDIINKSFRLATTTGSAVASVMLKESIRMTDQERSTAVERSRFRLIQTPQTFDIGLIKNAYEITEDPRLTDDASVAERNGAIISLFEGRYDNIKITTPEDLVVAEALMKVRAMQRTEKQKPA
ncbi:MAG TPA: 2-C-methyl-D-erythritol 4-phosphate cytidylyltransferase [Ohtaekwangia sp.]|nr:2-C-methyl-D-erythritol 4-phosphate cytidylyltransferase [Ohtaekwangia sp.]